MEQKFIRALENALEELESDSFSAVQGERNKTLRELLASMKEDQRKQTIDEFNATSNFPPVGHI